MTGARFPRHPVKEGTEEGGMASGIVRAVARALILAAAMLLALGVAFVAFSMGHD